jgi:hypothetical protein
VRSTHQAPATPFDFAAARLDGFADQEDERQQHQPGGEQGAGDADQRPAPPA